MAAVRCGHDHLPVGNRQISQGDSHEDISCSCFVRCAAVRGRRCKPERNSAKSPTAASDADTAGIRPAIVVGIAGTELADPTQQGAAQCHSGGVCDDYAIWTSLHAAP